MEHPSLAASTAKLEADVKTAQKEVARTRAELQDTKRKLQVATSLETPVTPLLHHMLCAKPPLGL